MRLINAHALHHFSQVVAPLFNANSQHQSFYTSLLAVIRHQVQCDSVAILLYRKDYQPMVVFDEMHPTDRNAFQANYFEGNYLLSPFYLHWMANRKESGLLRLAEICPDGFFDSVFYTDYYAHSGLQDELGYLIPLDNDSAMLISLGCIESASCFKQGDLAYLQAIQPIITQATQQHHQQNPQPQREMMQTWLEDGLTLFGSSRLTEREQAVVQLMLRGHSSKSCAKILGISPTTERVHRRNIYTKLGISSQAEVFSLFFNAMSDASPQLRQDPLINLQT